MNLESHIFEISRLRREADKLPDDNPGALMSKIELLARCLVFIGRLSSHLDGTYKRIYAKRKYEQALAVTRATKDKQAHAEIAVKELREEEAQSYEDMNRWRNAFQSTTEEIHSLKMRMKQDFQIEGANHVSTQRGSQTSA
ncbi:hypothetical protein [Paenibacillus prosopidis]|uniref:Uncharacterized protein n=1 Tax=Paenibacillus prosopidis TaxID=630520 RepID=A0A368VQR2_9BACL|nr:hypothetical protein [Paenibacillus prosopidis]RCW44250.1 hypothetical protein DFP97_112114 [Paenibacillus prosopidis]